MLSFATPSPLGKGRDRGLATLAAVRNFAIIRCYLSVLQRFPRGHDMGSAPSIHTDDDLVWSDVEVAAFLRRSLQTYRKDLRAGIGPPFVQLGRFRQYRPAAVRQWLISKERSPEAPPPAPRRGRPRKVRA